MHGWRKPAFNVAGQGSEGGRGDLDTQIDFDLSWQTETFSPSFRKIGSPIYSVYYKFQNFSTIGHILITFFQQQGTILITKLAPLIYVSGYFGVSLRSPQNCISYASSLVLAPLSLDRDVQYGQKLSVNIDQLKHL